MQKNAKSVSELHNVSHLGILTKSPFDEYFELRCYKPPKDLEPFIAYTWVQRQKKAYTASSKPLEICSGPNTYLFLTPKDAFIHGTVAQQFNYDPLVPGAIAGIKFKPGGFYPFYKRPMIRLADKTPPAHAVFSEITPAFTKEVLEQSNETIVASLETLLAAYSPEKYSGLDLIDRVIKKIDEDTEQLTVAEIARYVGRSERALQLLFQHHVGVSLKWTLNRKRLLKTISTAISFDSSWTHVAAQAGYSSQSHFTREFQQATGISPTAYRKLME